MWKYYFGKNCHTNKVISKKKQELILFIALFIAHFKHLPLTFLNLSEHKLQDFVFKL